jgi:hypothetical protein
VPAAAGRGSYTNYYDLTRLLLPESHVSAADAVLDGIAEGRVLDDADQGALGEAHVYEPPAESALAADIYDGRRIARAQGRQGDLALRGYVF